MNKLTKVLALAALLGATSAFATTSGNAAFGIFASQLGEWLTGNLGFIIAIISLVGSVILYAFTHKGAVIIIGIIIAFLAGGSVGIAKFFFGQGGAAFSDTGVFT